MAWADDKQRMAEMGRGPMLLCGLLLILAVAGIYQIALVWGVSRDFEATYGDGLAGAILRTKIFTIVNVVLFVSAAFGLFFSNSKAAVYLTIFTLAFTEYRSPFALYSSVVHRQIDVFLLFRVLDVLILLVPTVYLLTSREIDRLYHPGTRKLLMIGLPARWNRLRGRPTAEEAEAMNLNETFK